MSEYCLRFLSGPRAGTVFKMEGKQARLGRSSGNEIAIKDPLLSRDHCLFEVNDGELYLTDLASANETFVNEVAIDEVRLMPGDMVIVGESHIRVELAGKEAEAAALAVEHGGNRIDLGFGKEQGEAKHKGGLRMILWLAAGVCVLLGGTVFILESGNLLGGGEETAAPAPVVEDKTFEVYYECLDVGIDESLRYEIRLTAERELSSVRDVYSEKSTATHRDKTKKDVSPELIAQLAESIRNAGFYRLNEDLTGVAPNREHHKEYRLLVIDGKAIHRCRVLNRPLPDEFIAAQERLESFAKNELGTWTDHLSVDELLAESRKAYDIAYSFERDKDLKLGNLWEALKQYQLALLHMETLDPKPEYFEDTRTRIEAVTKAIDEMCRTRSVEAERTYSLKLYRESRQAQKEILEIVPDRSDDRYKTAERKILQIDSAVQAERNRR